MQASLVPRKGSRDEEHVRSGGNWGKRGSWEQNDRLNARVWRIFGFGGRIERLRIRFGGTAGRRGAPDIQGQRRVANSGKPGTGVDRPGEFGAGRLDGGD